VAIVGESGSGKTVTAKTILGLLPETAISSGAVVINGNNVISVSLGSSARSADAMWPWCSRSRPRH
jgi:ABC-type glutathione transport system ATPase component